MNRRFLVGFWFCILLVGLFVLSRQLRTQQIAHAQTSTIAFTAHQTIYAAPGTPNERVIGDRITSVASDGTEAVSASLPGRPALERSVRTTTADGMLTVGVGPLAAKSTTFETDRQRAARARAREVLLTNRCMLPELKQTLLHTEKYLGYDAYVIQGTSDRPLGRYYVRKTEWRLPALDCFSARAISETITATGEVHSVTDRRTVLIDRQEPPKEVMSESATFEEMAPSEIHRKWQERLQILLCTSCDARVQTMDKRYAEQHQR